MEGYKLDRSEEADESKDELDSKKKKSSSSKIGKFSTVEASDKSTADRIKDFLDLFSVREIDSDKDKVQAETTKSDSNSEIPDSATEIVLAPELELQIEHDIVETRSEQLPEDLDSDPIKSEISQTIANFHAKILSENKDSSLALTETIKEIDQIINYPEDRRVFEKVMLDQADNRAHELTDEAVKIEHNEINMSKLEAKAIYNPFSFKDKVNSNILKPETASPATNINQDTKSLFESIKENLIKPITFNAQPEIADSDIDSKIEKRIKAINQNIIARENVIRKVVIGKYESSDELINVKPESKNQLPRVQPEKIGKVLLMSKPENAIPVETSVSGSTMREIETMNRASLLELSNNIYIDGANLRSTYENRLIGEKALRRIVAKHLLGGNVKKALKAELLDHEIDFERDPQLRDKAMLLNQSTAKLNELIIKNQLASEPENYNQRIAVKAQAKYRNDKSKLNTINLGTADAIMGLTIAVLLFLVIITFINLN
jgi:hypothetical protein